MLRGETGTPMRRMARANSSFADADPEPLMLANLTTKSLTASIFCIFAPYLGGETHDLTSLLAGEGSGVPDDR
jgi:hypothetical protein